MRERSTVKNTIMYANTTSDGITSSTKFEEVAYVAIKGLKRADLSAIYDLFTTDKLNGNVGRAIIEMILETKSQYNFMLDIRNRKKKISVVKYMAEKLDTTERYIRIILRILEKKDIITNTQPTIQPTIKNKPLNHSTLPRT